MSAALELRRVSVRYGHIEALRGISLVVNEGEIVGIIGRNGAGKTTMLKAISGLVPVADGEVSVFGEKTRGVPAYRIVELGVVHVPEGRRVFPRMSVWENLALGAYTRSYGATVTRDLARIYEMFPVLAERRDQAAGNLSGGEQQMLAIGRALMAQPRVLMLDEPSMGLAPIFVKRMWSTLREINWGRHHHSFGRTECPCRARFV
jgi:branched-chain amino acid transport system ATP-binding protein